MTTIPHPHARPRRKNAPRAIALLCGLCVAALTGCAATSAGSRGHDNFERESVAVELTGAQAPARAAACFEEQARFLPRSEFSRDGAQFTYRLRVSDLWFEQVRVGPAEAGSRAEIRLASNLDARWSAQFDADRLQPLRRCLAP
jgi:hypothetical protein